MNIISRIRPNCISAPSEGGEWTKKCTAGWPKSKSGILSCVLHNVQVLIIRAVRIGQEIKERWVLKLKLRIKSNILFKEDKTPIPHLKGEIDNCLWHSLKSCRMNVLWCNDAGYNMGQPAKSKSDRHRKIFKKYFMFSVLFASILKFISI